MGLFRPYETSDQPKGGRKVSLTPKPTAKDEASDAAPTASPAAGSGTDRPADKAPAKKSVPTPTRKAAEAARMERLHPTLSKKEAKRKAREANRERNEDAWSRAERSPERELLRDYVDSRWTLSEFTLPIMLVFLALTMLSGSLGQPTLTMWVTFTLWGFLIGFIINIAGLWRGFKRELADRLPKASTRGLLMYLINRSMMIRRFRQPRPRLNRGDQY